MKDPNTIESVCPCCGTDLIVDIESGEVLAYESLPPASYYASGITVQHATPEYHHYYDSTHQQTNPKLIPLTPSPTESSSSPVELNPQLSEEEIEKIKQYNRLDLRNRGII